MITSQELRDARHRADLTQAELASRMGVSLRTVTNWEGANGPLPDRAEAKIMEALGATVVRVRRGMRNIHQLESEQDGHDPVREQSLKERGFGGEERKRRMLSMFTDVDLLHELTSRSRQRGSTPSNWTARALESDTLRLDLIREVAADFDNLTGNVRDFEDDAPVLSREEEQELRKSEHDLAAYRGHNEANIPHAE